MSGNYSVVTNPVVNVQISSTGGPNKFIPIEKKISRDESVRSVKGRLEVMTSADRNTMTVKVYDRNDKLVCELDNDDALLGSYHIDDGMRLHVEDEFRLRKSLEDDANVEKFVMPEEEYSKRTDTVKAYLEKNKLGKYNPEETARREAEKKREEEEEENAVKKINVSDRCLVSVPGQPMRRGQVMFVGKTEFKPGWWVGVKYDEPMGKNDGTVAGKKYFTCPPKYGGFVKPIHVEVGDFPEEDELGLDDEL